MPARSREDAPDGLRPEAKRNEERTPTSPAGEVSPTGFEELDPPDRQPRHGKQRSLWRGALPMLFATALCAAVIYYAIQWLLG